MVIFHMSNQVVGIMTTLSMKTEKESRMIYWLHGCRIIASARKTPRFSHEDIRAFWLYIGFCFCIS